jgi:anaerobic selenocysteine-containing dehydrogenase
MDQGGTGGPHQLTPFPPIEKWDHWEEVEASAWPKREKKQYAIVPTVCFNCEAACGLVAYVDKQTMEVRKLEGNPYNPASRGRNCAKGPATLNQIQNPSRLLHPMRRSGPRGSGQWTRVSWEEALADIADRIRKAIAEDRRHEIMYHVGRPGEDGFVERTLVAWGLDAHNSHTNVCSSGARLGYDLWMGNDRPSPDYAHARFILLLSSHLETGHYFNPHAQRIIEAKQRGAKIAVMDTRLSNTASMADSWLPTWPGSEAAVLLAMARVLIEENRFDRAFVEKWVNWEAWLKAEGRPLKFESFVEALKETYSRFTPEFAEQESGLAAAKIVETARQIGEAGSRFSAHVWRNAASGNLHGWMVARALFFLNVLTGSVGTEGGTLPNSWSKFVPVPFKKPPPQKTWNELLYPREYPFCHHEMSILLPHFLKEGRGRLEVYFTRAYNPVWTNPDGFNWIEMLTDEKKIGLHVALSPEWNETTHYADYVLPMGYGPERYDTMSFETHAGQWLAFRQPVRRVVQEMAGRPVEFTYQANPGEVWEENEFWLELSWRIDPDGALAIRPYFESPYRPGEKMSIQDHYRWIFENSVPGLPEAAKKENLSPYDYMKKYGAFEVSRDRYRLHEAAHGFPTPSKKLEFYSATLAEWGWKEYALPCYERSHVSRDKMAAPNEFPLIPTYRLPTQIHTRTGTAKWLWELGNSNPVIMNPRDARRLGLKNGELVRVVTETGHFVNRLWLTEGLMPGVVACSHHFGRWRLDAEHGSLWSTSLVDLVRDGTTWKLRQKEPIRPFKSPDPDSQRVFWKEAGVHQNLTFAPHPDPLSGMHCWHQKVRVEKAAPGDRYGDVEVDTQKGYEVYREWLKLTRPGPGPGGLRRPMWIARPYRPDPSAYRA